MKSEFTGREGEVLQRVYADVFCGVSYYCAKDIRVICGSEVPFVTPLTSFVGSWDTMTGKGEELAVHVRAYLRVRVAVGEEPAGSHLRPIDHCWSTLWRIFLLF